jgi:outer membrane protein assembly factor BamB
LVILDGHIYALSDLNYMISLDREKGNMIFGNSVAPAGLPIVGLELYEDKLLSLIGDTLVEIDSGTGGKLSTWQPEVSIVCPAAHNSSYFYLAGADRRLRVLRVEDMVRVFEVAADNESMITSIIADENFVIFATDGGNVISITPDRPNRLWQFDAAGSIVGPIVRDVNSLFFACKDTNLYRIDMVDMQTVNLVWKYQTNALLDKAPYVTAEVAYQRAGDKGLAAIDKKSGKLLWQLAESADLLAEANGKAYVITKTSTLVVMDNNKGKKLYSANFAQASRYATNIMDSKIYIANKDGRIACITPAE